MLNVMTPESGNPKMSRLPPQSVSNVLAELGWDESHAIPVANEENQKLILQLEDLRNNLLRKTNEFNLENSKVTQLKEHLKNVEQEIRNTSTLCDIRDKAINDEKHHSKIMASEFDRVYQDTKILQRIQEDLLDKKSRFENIAFQKRNELESSSNRINANKEMLEEYMKKIENRDEDLEILDKYIRQDNSKLKELELESQKLTKTFKDRKSQLHHLHTKTQTYQTELDNTTKDVKIAYAERDDLISQWEAVINRMRQRDAELNHFIQSLNEVKAEVASRRQTNRENMDFLRIQQENSADAQRRIDETVASIGQVKQELVDTESKRQDFRSELEALKRTVDKAASDLESTRAHNGQLRKQNEEKHNKLEIIRADIQKLRERLVYITEAKLSAEQCADEADKQLNAEERKLEALNNLINQLRDKKYKVNQQSVSLEQEQKRWEQQILGDQASAKILKAKIAKADAQILKQLEIIYKQDFHIQQVEQRISRMKGEQNMDEAEQLQAKIDVLAKELDEKTNTTLFLSGQLANIHREVYRNKRELEMFTSKNDVLENQLQANEAEVQIAYKEKDKRSALLQKLMVDKNLMRLEVRRLTKILDQYLNKKFSLEKAREDLDYAIKERAEQINLHQTMLNAQNRLGREENSQLRIEIQNRKSRIDKLIKRFEILTALMSPPEGEEARTQAYFIIKAAQEKELLQQKGDILDAETKQAEQELIALENTLMVMNGCNTVYRLSQSKLPDDAEELQQQKELNENIRVLSIKLRYDRARVNELKQIESNIQETETRLNDDIEIYREKVEYLKMTEIKKRDQLTKQNESLQRTRKRLQKLCRLVVTMESLPEEQRTELQQDLEARLAKELVNQMTAELINRVKSDPVLTDQTFAMLTASGLPTSSIARRISGLTMGATGKSIGTTPTSSVQSSPPGSGNSSQIQSAREGNEPYDGREQTHRSSISSLIPLTTTSIDLGEQVQIPGGSQPDNRTKSRHSSSAMSDKQKSGSDRSQR